MGTKHKTPAVLDAMIDHVRYEVLQVIRFAQLGNGWCDLLRPDVRAFTQHSILEAALIHFRCLIEFLSEAPTSDQVTARDYLRGWDWVITDQLSQVQDLHGRLAHLGVVRRSVATDGDFDWQPWLTREAPAVLRAFREFVVRLAATSPQRYQLFIQARDHPPVPDLLALLDSVLVSSRHR